MASFDERMKTSQRRGSAVVVVSNPLESTDTVKAVKVETVSQAHPIDAAEFRSLLKILSDAGVDSNNAALLDTLEREKTPHLFSSSQLIQIISLTPSVKTRLAIVDHISPRLLDPRAEYDNLVGLFRYSEEKTQVEEALKSRIHTLNHSVFKKESSAVFSRGGRGRGLSSGKSMFMGGRLGGQRPSSLPVPLRSEDIFAKDVDDDGAPDSPNDERADGEAVVQRTGVFKGRAPGEITAAAVEAVSEAFATGVAVSEETRLETTA